MAMTNCPDCGKSVSDQSSSCINCGYPLKKDLQRQPSAGSADAAKKGRQRSKLRNDMGSAIAFVGIISAVIVGAVSSSFLIGFLVAFISTGIGIWVAYGS